MGSALSGRRGVGKTFGTEVGGAVVAGGSVGAIVGWIVVVGVMVKLADGTDVAAVEVFRAGIVTSRGRGVLVTNAWARSVGWGVGVADRVEVGSVVEVNEGVVVGVVDGVLVLVGRGVGVRVLDAVAVAVGWGVLVVKVGNTASTVAT